MKRNSKKTNKGGRPKKKKVKRVLTLVENVFLSQIPQEVLYINEPKNYYSLIYITIKLLH